MVSHLRYQRIILQDSPDAVRKSAMIHGIIFESRHTVFGIVIDAMPVGCHDGQAQGHGLYGGNSQSLPEGGEGIHIRVFQQRRNISAIAQEMDILKIQFFGKGNIIKALKITL